MDESQELSASVVDAVSLARALQDAEVANLRVIALAKEVLDRDERIAKLDAEIVALKRLLDPRRKAEHIIRSNYIVHSVARRTKRMIGW